MKKRVFLIVLDSVGVGELPDANAYGDVGSNTLRSVSTHESFTMPHMKNLGFFNIDGIDTIEGCQNPTGSYARMVEKSNGKDTTVGHWEIAGVISNKALPTYPKGFPKEVMDKFKKLTGRNCICNLPYSGTKLLDDYAKEHMQTGDLIVYTSADSVFQIAAHESVIPIEELYGYCEMARELLRGEHGVGRVIARPFIGAEGSFKRTANRRDFSLEPPKKTMLDYLCDAKKEVIGVGKIYDIFAGQGITKKIKTTDNRDGMNQTTSLLRESFNGLAFVNLVDFDMQYGHRNDVSGYANALSEFDVHLSCFLKGMKEDDICIITADHGCDPATASTDHSREYTPMVIFGDSIKANVNLGTRASFADIAATVAEYLGVPADIAGVSFLSEVSV
ncbi:MAG: phosphopentomutase [Oscillospiraceae bacterium]